MLENVWTPSVKLYEVGVIEDSGKLSPRAEETVKNPLTRALELYSPAKTLKGFR
jgi:hypothetical protein